MRQKPAPWHDAHIRLKQLYDEKAPAGMSQKQFGLAFGIGSQSMVAQYLNGNRPLNFEAAAKFAKGLRCTIYEISPEMAESLKHEIFPVSGPRGWLLKTAKAAMVVGALFTIPPSPAEAASHNRFSECLYTHCRRIWLSFCPKHQWLVS